MTDDIVTRLREHFPNCECHNASLLIEDAADEIERLRADRDRWRKIAAELAMPLRHRFDPKGAWDSVNLPHERAVSDEQAEG